MRVRLEKLSNVEHDISQEDLIPIPWGRFTFVVLGLIFFFSFVFRQSFSLCGVERISPLLLGFSSGHRISRTTMHEPALKQTAQGIYHNVPSQSPDPPYPVEWLKRTPRALSP